MDVGLVLGGAVGLFVVTNVDDLVLLTLYFGRVAGDPAAERRVVAGQYLGFVAILVVSLGGAAAGRALLSTASLAYLGLLPLAIGMRAAVLARRDHREGAGPDAASRGPLTVPAVAAVTLANGGDNVSVYIPVFASSGPGRTVATCALFLVLVAVWCAAARLVGTRRPVVAVLDRAGHVLLPVVLMGVGVVILVRGGAFGL